MITGAATGLLGFAGALSLTKWARLQEYETTARELNWPDATVDVIAHRKRRYLVLSAVCGIAVMLIFAAPPDHSRTPGGIIAAVGALSLAVAFVLSLWWARCWRRNPGVPPLPGRYW